MIPPLNQTSAAPPLGSTEVQTAQSTQQQSLPGPDVAEKIHAGLAALASKKPGAVDTELGLKQIIQQLRPTSVTLRSLREDYQRLIEDAGNTNGENELDLVVKQDDDFSEEEINLAKELLNSPDLFEEFHEDFKPCGYKASRELTDDGLLALGRTLRHWSSGEYGHGKLGSGKTEFYNHVASYFPQAKTISLTTFSEKFLFYAGDKGGNALKGFLMIYGESDLADKTGGDSLKQQYLRQLLTENRITQGTVEHENRKNKAKYLVLNGPLTVVITGVDSPSQFDPQTRSRLYCRSFIHTHDTIKQVLESKASRAANPRIEYNTSLYLAQRKWRAAFIQLDKLDPADPAAIQAIEIPFAQQLVFRKEKHTEQDMRAFDRLIESIEVSALLHQKQRELKGQTLVATWDDFINVKAAYFSSVPAAKGLGHDLINKFLLLLQWWQKPENKGKKSKREIYEALNVDDSTGKKWIYAWVKAELLDDKTESDKRTTTRYYQPAVNAQAIGSKMLADESLGIDGIVFAGNSRTSDTCTQILGTSDALACVSTENTKLDQAIPSDQDVQPELGTCPSLVQLGIAELLPSESDNSSVSSDINGACPAHFDKYSMDKKASQVIPL